MPIYLEMKHLGQINKKMIMILTVTDCKNATVENC